MTLQDHVDHINSLALSPAKKAELVEWIRGLSPSFRATIDGLLAKMKAGPLIPNNKLRKVLRGALDRSIRETGRRVQP